MIFVQGRHILDGESLIMWLLDHMMSAIMDLLSTANVDQIVTYFNSSLERHLPG